MQNTYNNIDIIGDIHGCANTLEELLQLLGYTKKSGVYQHKSRKVLFLGDIIDRGPRIRKALEIVYFMVQTDNAICILGNHEQNAVEWHTVAPPNSGKIHVREHSDRNFFFIKQTLDQFAAYENDLQEYIRWFKTIPLFLEHDLFNAAHACFSREIVDKFQSLSGGAVLTDNFIQQCARDGSTQKQVSEVLLRGVELDVPDKYLSFLVSNHGYHKKKVRAKFWLDNPKNYGELLLHQYELPVEFSDMQVTEQDRKKAFVYDSIQKPLFIGHYWFKGTPEIIQANIACLDWSAVIGGKLVAYRYDGEQVLSNNKFLSVDVHADEIYTDFY